MAIKAIIFDLSGVVLFTIRGNYESLLAERLGVPVEAVARVMNDAMNDRWDMAEISDDEFYDHMLAKTGQPPEKKPILKKFVIDDFYIDAEMIALIRELRGTYITALLSNFPAHVHDFMKRAWFVDGAFDHLIISSDVKLIKPDPRIFTLALERIGCEAHEAVFIDDTRQNVEAAEALGIRSILFTNKAQAIADLKQVLRSSR